MLKPESSYIVDVREEGWNAQALDHLDEHGFVVLRNAVSHEQADLLQKDTEYLLNRPALSGTIGYYMKDPHKKMFDALLFGRHAVDIVTNMDLVGLAEAYVGDECLMSEIFWKHDMGTNHVYFPFHCHTEPDRAAHYDGPFGVGTLCYIYDTDEGAFCYSIGSHKWPPEHGDNPDNYPEEARRRIVEGMRRVAGLAGDLVVFDEYGFHGPEQPTTQPRTVLIFGYQRKKDFGNTTRSPAPVILNHLSHLSPKQLNILGLGAGLRKELKDYHIHGFDKNPAYVQIARRLERSFDSQRNWAKRRHFVKSLLNRRH